MTEPTDKELTAKALYMLNQKYSRQFGWSTFFEVHLGKHRADFIAFNIYPSRNFPIVGCEIKASRPDWLKELENPAKADSIILNCDEWYIVEAKKDIVRKEELPKGWGLITPSGKGLKVAVPSNIPAPIVTREFIARIVEQSLFGKDRFPSTMLWEAEQRGYTKGKAEGVPKYQFDRIKEKADVLDKLKANGIDFYEWRLSDIKKVKQAMDLLEHLENIEYNLGCVKDAGTAVVERVDNAIKTINETSKNPKEGSNGQPNDQTAL
jgi:hypothetical protein